LIGNQHLLLVTHQLANFTISPSNVNVDSRYSSMIGSIEVSWTHPPHDNYKINIIDIFHKKSLGISTYGDLIIDSHGKFVRGFYRLSCYFTVWSILWDIHIEIDTVNIC